jgi:hypothetical protein
MNKTMADFLKEEMKNLDGMVYFSKPYPCAETEALMYFKQFNAPAPEQMKIERTEKQITVSIKPIKGSGKRKTFVIRMWVS